MPRGAAVALLALLGVALFAAQADAARIFAINQSETSVTRVVSGTAIFEGDYARRSSQVLGSILNLCQECMCDVAQVTFRTSFSSAPIGHVSISKVEYKDTTTMGGMGLMAFIIPESVTTRGASIAVCRSPWQVSTNLWVTSAAYTFFGR